MDKLTERIAFLGAGNMARAIAGGMIKAGLVEPSQITASDVAEGALDALEQATGGRRAASNAAAAAGADVIVIATKPFQVGDVCREIREAAAERNPLVVSICAGIPTSAIEQHLGGEPRVVRVMPNTPALIGCGSAACAPGRFVRPGDLDLTVRIFQSVGSAIAVDESKLDLVTGLTGSGPAYVFRFMEALIAAGTELGLSAEEAAALVPRMVLGAARMAVEGTSSLADLRNAVTTKGGTTEAGLRVLEEGEFLPLIQEAVARAAERSRELSKG